MDSLIFGTVLGLSLLMIGFIGYGEYKQSQSPTFTLYKNEFKCVKAHKETTFIWSGKIIIPITEPHCDQYNRIN